VYVPVPFSERVDVDGAVTHLIEPNSRGFQVALLRNLDLFLATQDPAVRARIGTDLEAAARANAWTSFSSWRGKANEPVHFLRMAILAAAITAQVVFDDPEAPATRRGSVRMWINRMVAVADGAADDLANGPDRDAGRAAAYMTWGAVSGNERVFRLGLESFVGVSAMMRSDGSYAAFVGGPFTRYIRPDYQLRYNNMMVGWMVVAAEAAAANGLDLYGHRFRNGSLHDAVHWQVMATFNPDFQRLTGHPQATPYVKAWSPAAENMAWAAAYVARFRDRPASGEILRRGVLPAFGGDYGGQTTCLYWKTP
jgi:hypothetical protein